MPLGGLDAQYRLGVSNTSEKNANSFLQTVLKLPSAAPIYQQQLVHNLLRLGRSDANAAGMGPLSLFVSAPARTLLA
jgi:hypothetical protein